MKKHISKHREKFIERIEKNKEPDYRSLIHQYFMDINLPDFPKDPTEEQKNSFKRGVFFVLKLYLDYHNDISKKYIFDMISFVDNFDNMLELRKEVK